MTERRGPIEINVSLKLNAVIFSADGQYIFSGGDDGVQVWRVEDGKEIAIMETRRVECLAVSKDGRWIAAGTVWDNVHVWDTNTYEQVFASKGGSSTITGVDFSPDSSRLVAALWGGAVTVSDIGTRKRVQILTHEDKVVAAKYSPQGDRIATATPRSVRVYDNNGGSLLVYIEAAVNQWYNTGLVWFDTRLLVVSDGKIKRFEASTGSAVSEWPVPDTDQFSCIALPKTGEFIACSAKRTVTLWDTATRTRLGLIPHPQVINSIALSPDDQNIAIGGNYGKIIIQSLSPIVASKQEQHSEQPSTSGGHGNNPADATLEGPGKPGLVESESNNEDRGSDLLDLELPSSTPGPLFNYDEPPSPATSTHTPEDQVPPLGSSHPVSQPLDVRPVASPPEISHGGHLNATKSSQRLSMLRGWLHKRVKKSSEDPTPNKPDRLSRKSRRLSLANSRSPSRSPTRNAVNGGPPRMAAGKRQRRTVWKSTTELQRKQPTKAVALKDASRNASSSRQSAADPSQTGAVLAVPHQLSQRKQPAESPVPKKDTSRSTSHHGQGVAEPDQAGVQADDGSQHPIEIVRVTRHLGLGKTSITLTLPDWMLCFRSGAGDGTH